MLIRGNKSHTVCILIAQSGAQYILAGGRGIGRRGATLLLGADGLDKILYTAITTQSARQAGATWIDRTEDVRDIMLPILLDPVRGHERGTDSSAALARLRESFLRDVFSGPFKLCFFTPALGWRWIECRADSYMEQEKHDAAHLGATLIDLECTAYDPRYRSWTDRQDIFLGESTEVELHNRGDDVCYPVLQIRGVSNQRTSLEIDGHEVELPRLVNATESLIVNSKPSAQRLVSTLRGPIPWTDTAYKRIDLSIEPGQARTIVVSTKGHREGVSRIQTFCPVHYRTGY